MSNTIWIRLQFHCCHRRTLPPFPSNTLPGEARSRQGSSRSRRKGFAGGALPGGHDLGVVTNRLWSVKKKVPDHCPCLVVESPGRTAFGHACIVRWGPVVERHVRTRLKMGTLCRRRACADPSHKSDTVPLPDRMENTRTRPTVRINCSHTRPHNMVRHLHESWCGFTKIVHRISPIAD